MIDVSVSYRKYSFLGREFLTWLWFKIDSGFDCDELGVGEILELGNKIVCEKQEQGYEDTITIKSDKSGFSNGKLALNKGAFVSEMSLKFLMGEYEWRFCINSESFNYTSLRHPQTESLKRKEEFEGAVLEKHYLTTRVYEFMDKCFKRFIKLRISMDWNQEVKNISEWIREG